MQVPEPGPVPGQEAETADLPMEEQEEQMMLMLFAYSEKLRNQGRNTEADAIDFSNLEENKPSVQAAAVAEWVTEENGSSLAIAFRTYMDEHPGKIIDFHNFAALKGLLTTLKGEEVLH